MNKLMKSPKNLILYKDFENGKLFYNMTWIMENYENEYYNKEDVESLLYESLNQLMELAVSHGFEGNLWHSFLAFLLVNNENAYSKACEIRGKVEGSVNQIILHDFEIIKSLFDFDFGKLASYFEMDCMDAITDYQSMTGSGKIFNKRIKERINELKLNLEASTDVSGFKDAVTAFYKDFGVGKLGLHKANNCLLYGDAGTGKSTSIKAIANQYYDRGLRLIEVYKHQFCDLNDVIAQIKNRNYKFIIYMDDLSFEEFEIEYKYLKAVIEGGLEKKPDNVLIYATSNRRHLIRETFSDKEEVREDMHTSDTVQEKLSLYARFGVSIYFGAPNKKEFQNIVKVLAEKYQVSMDEDTLLAEANKWELSHGGLSGRTAQQFINYLLGKE